MKYFALIAVLACANAIAASAFWTGQQEMVTTVTGQVGWRCEYNYNGQIFYRVFIGGCPSSIEVQ